MSGNSTPIAPSAESESGWLRARTARWTRRHTALVCVLAAASAMLYWKDEIKGRLIVKNWGVIEPREIYRSGQISKYLIERQLVDYNIDVIVDLSERVPGLEYQDFEIETAQRLDIELRRFALGGDGTGDINSYAGAIESLVECRQQGRVALLHCQAGADRTGGVTYCYRTLVQKKSPDEALEEMLSYGWSPRGDNPLIAYLDQNMAGLAQMLVDRGVIAAVPDPLPLLPVDRD